MPRNKFRTERIQLGSGRLDLFAEPDELRATLDLDIDESTQHAGRSASRERAQRSARLAAARPDRRRVRSHQGRAAARSGNRSRRGQARRRRSRSAARWAQPEFDGDFHLRDGRLELYRTNLVVSALQLDGKFSGDELKFAADGKTAKGKLTIDGQFSWPEGVMTGAMRLRGDELLVADTPEYRVLASPDIVLHAGTDGYRVEGEVLIPSARISPRELTTSVGTSPDERIVGLRGRGGHRAFDGGADRRRASRSCSATPCAWRPMDSRPGSAAT